RRTMVRAAIELLLQRPSLAALAEPPYPFSGLDQAGIPLLAELLDSCRARPEISTGALLDSLADHPDLPALTRLAMQEIQSPPEGWDAEFQGALQGLELQALEQRQRELQLRAREIGGISALSAAEKDELRMLQQQILERRAAAAAGVAG